MFLRSFTVLLFFLLQALELARSVQSQRDLGCQASQVVYLEEGLNCDDSLAEDFWRLLGGRRQYRGELEIFILLEIVTWLLAYCFSSPQELVRKKRTRSTSEAWWSPTVCTGWSRTGWFLMRRPGPPSPVFPYWAPPRLWCWTLAARSTCGTDRMSPPAGRTSRCS